MVFHSKVVNCQFIYSPAELRSRTQKINNKKYLFYNLAVAQKVQDSNDFLGLGLGLQVEVIG